MQAVLLNTWQNLDGFSVAWNQDATRTTYESAISDATDAVPASEGPVALGRLRNLLDDAYQQFVYMGEDRDSYRHLPAVLNGPPNLKHYVSCYMAAVSMLTELTAWQKLAMFDYAHRSSQSSSRKISRAKLNGLWESITSWPMFPAVHARAIRKAIPVMAGPDSLMIHPQYIQPKSAPAQATPHMDRMPYTTWNDWVLSASTGYYTVNVLDDNSRTLFREPDTDDFFNEIIDFVDDVESVFLRRKTGMDNGIVEDIANIQALFRMLKLPQNLTRWEDIPAYAVDPGLHDQLYSRGLFGGTLNFGTTTIVHEQSRYYPYRDATRGYIEFRGIGSPTEDMFIGDVPYSAENNLNLPTHSPFYILGATSWPGKVVMENGASPDKSWYNMLPHATFYTQEDGWVSTFSQLGEQDFFRQHQYSKLVTAGAQYGHLLDIRVNDPVDYTVFVPVEDIAYNWLAKISQDLMIPFVG